MFKKFLYICFWRDLKEKYFKLCNKESIESIYFKTLVPIVVLKDICLKQCLESLVNKNTLKYFSLELLHCVEAVIKATRFKKERKIQIINCATYIFNLQLNLIHDSDLIYY